MGMSTIGAVTFESAAYVARYVVKKLTGPRAAEYGGRVPEFGVMSRRPGIGKGWFDQFANEVYPADSVVTRGRECRPPRFYDSMLESESPLEAFLVKRKRAQELRLEDQTEARLLVRETVASARVSLHRRVV